MAVIVGYKNTKNPGYLNVDDYPEELVLIKDVEAEIDGEGDITVIITYTSSNDLL